MECIRRGTMQDNQKENIEVKEEQCEEITNSPSEIEMPAGGLKVRTGLKAGGGYEAISILATGRCAE